MSKQDLFLGMPPPYFIQQKVPQFTQNVAWQRLPSVHHTLTAKSQLPNGGQLILPSPAKSRSISDLQQKIPSK